MQVAIELVLMPCAVLLDENSSARAQSDMEAAKEFFSTAGVPGDHWTGEETMFFHVAPAIHSHLRRLAIKCTT